MDKSFVSCHVLGQLGNQLFILATTLSYAWDNDKLAFFPELHKTDFRISYNREKLFFRLDASPLPHPHKKEFWQKYWFSFDPIPNYVEDVYLFGYFQSWKYFHHHRDKLLTLFAPREDTLEYLYKKYKELIEHPYTVSIHVRTNCKRTHELAPFVGVEYIKNAMSLFPKGARFALFSDRINWCKKHFSNFEEDIVFIEGNDGVEDLILMSMMKHHIIAGSTFSWWGAYLNQNPAKQVVAPSITSIGSPIENFYLPEWTVLPLIIKPYPEDMYDYDKKSQSIDNN